MRDNVRAFAQLTAQVFDAPEPVLEVGSRAAEGQEAVADVRSFFGGKAYLGSDFMAGTGVDLLLDGHMMGVREGAVGSLIALDTLEHVQDPFLVLSEAHRVLQDGGLLIVAVPMMFPVHNHPWDYWRYTPAALDLLLRRFGGRAVFQQGDPDAPHAVYGLAVRSDATDELAAFDARVEELLARWDKNVPGGPLLRFEPLADALVHDAGPDVQPRALSELTAGNRVEQEFVCALDGLTRIDLKLTFRKPTSSVVSYHLDDVEAGDTVATGEIRGLHLLDKAWTPLRSPAVPASAGRRYRLTLESLDGSPGDAVIPLLGAGAAPEGTRLEQDAKQVDGCLCMRVLCREAEYEPVDYRRLAGVAGVPQVVSRPSAPDAVRKLSNVQAEQLWYVSSRMNERFDGLSKRVEALERRVDDVLLFVKNIQDSAPFRAAKKVGGLFRRSGG